MDEDEYISEMDGGEFGFFSGRCNMILWTWYDGFI